MSAVIKAHFQVFLWFLLLRQRRPGHANSLFWMLLEIIGLTLDVKAKFKSREKCLK
jgi:hypothetical protein